MAHMTNPIGEMAQKELEAQYPRCWCYINESAEPSTVVLVKSLWKVVKNAREAWEVHKLDPDDVEKGIIFKAANVQATEATIGLSSFEARLFEVLAFGPDGEDE